MMRWSAERSRKFLNKRGTEWTAVIRMDEERLESRRRLVRGLLTQDSWGEAEPTGTERKGLAW